MDRGVIMAIHYVRKNKKQNNIFDVKVQIHKSAEALRGHRGESGQIHSNFSTHKSRIFSNTQYDTPYLTSGGQSDEL